MKDFLKHVPGFRSNTTWKKIMAGFFYFAMLFGMITEGVQALLIGGGIMLLVLSVKGLVDNKKNKEPLKTPLLLLLVGIILFNSGSQLASSKSIVAEENEAIRVVEEEKDNLQVEITKLREENTVLEGKNKELTEENERLVAEERKRKEEVEELAKKEEEAKLAEEQRIEEEAKKQEEAKKLEVEKKEKEAAAAKSQQSAKSSSSSGANVSKSAPAKQGVDNTAQILRTKSGTKYHRRKCGNGNFFATTLNEAKAIGLSACSKCF